LLYLINGSKGGHFRNWIIQKLAINMLQVAAKQMQLLIAATDKPFFVGEKLRIARPLLDTFSKESALCK
jgi:hypothetical protein